MINGWMTRFCIAISLWAIALVLTFSSGFALATMAGYLFFSLLLEGYELRGKGYEE